MCGIFAVVNGSKVTNGLINGLEALAYRGYDSAGIAVINEYGLERRRAAGKLKSLTDLLKQKPIDGRIGIAHTRWATHGKPNALNAHPHMTDKVAVAHNGIIENYTELRSTLEETGFQFKSDTDSEVIPLMITDFLNQGYSNTEALKATIDKLQGSFALAVLFKNKPKTLYASRRASPLVIGKGNDAYYLASDATALARHAVEICYLEDGDIACIESNAMTIENYFSKTISRPRFHISNSKTLVADKNGYAHFMLKEIYEQPAVIERTILQFLDPSGTAIKHANAPLLNQTIGNISIIACGSSLLAGKVAQYWLESLAKLPTKTDIASEYRYRDAPLDVNNLALFISQSGETADTLAALRYAKSLGQSCFSVINQPQSSMAKESIYALQTLAGPEIGVASTKAFTAQLCVLLLFTLQVARSHQCINPDEEKRLVNRLLKLPIQTRQLLLDGNTLACIRKAATCLNRASSAFYLGRGIAYPLAAEGALKLKEITYIHAEAYPAGELKHGPIALVDENLPVVMIAPPGPLAEKSLSNLREIHSRGAKVILISDKRTISATKDFVCHSIVMPDIEPVLQPILYNIPLQLLAYEVALLRGTDVDQPRNLAKSVTVE